MALKVQPYAYDRSDRFLQLLESSMPQAPLSGSLTTLLERCALVTAAADGPPSGRITADHIATLATCVGTDVEAFDALLAIVVEARRQSAEVDAREPQKSCTRCNGTGRFAPGVAGAIECGRCDGTGRVPVHFAEVRTIDPRMCVLCRGEGKRAMERKGRDAVIETCVDCNGTGQKLP